MQEDWNIILSVLESPDTSLIGQQKVFSTSPITLGRGEENDLLISRSGTSGVVTVVPKEAEGFAFGSFMIRFQVDKKKADSHFIPLVMNSKLIQEQIQRERMGALQGNITIPSIKSIKIPVPPLSIQKEIVKNYYDSKRRADELRKKAERIESEAKEEVEKMVLG